MAALPPLLGDDGFVLPLQNGVEAAGQLAAALGPERVIGGLARILSYIAAPGRIAHVGGATSLAFGELDNRPSARVERLWQAFSGAGVSAEIAADIEVALWQKFLFVVPFGGLGAVMRAPAGVWRDQPETRQMLRQAMTEIWQVAQARGVRLAAGAVERTIGIVDRLPPEATASLQRDIVAGRPSELEAWNGAVVRLGREAGVATPLHAFIYYSLLPQERQARAAV
jgi:2-dehydropantoate 2-reductase